MNKQLRRVSILILLMFTALLTSTTIIQVIQADTLNADGRNARTIYDSYSTQRGSILVGGEAVAESVPTDDQFEYQRVYTGDNPELYSSVLGYYTLGLRSAGIESELNAELSGTSDAAFLDQITRLFTGQEAEGLSVSLTLDAAVQQAAYDALASRGYTGSVVALDPETGRVLAMVSTPGYDPNVLASHDTGAVSQAIADYDADPTAPLTNRAISPNRTQPPGSTFKVLMAAAGIDSGELTPESTAPNPAELQLTNSQSVIFNSTEAACGVGDEEVSLADALRLSCNIPFAQFGPQIGADTVNDYAEAFGWNDPELSVPLPTNTSSFPTETVVDDNDVPQLQLASFGQGAVTATPLQIAMLSAAIANDGQLMRPNLVDSILAPNLDVVEGFSPEVYSTPISSESAATMTDMMVADIANGVGNNAGIPGVDVAGKTGTAELTDENGEALPYTLWFTGFAPADDPQVAIAVMVENGGGLGVGRGSGNDVAAPVAREVMEAVLNR